MKKTMTTIVNFVLDQSGSMEEVRESTISGFNEYIKTLQDGKGKFLFTLTKFSCDGFGRVRLNRPYTLTPIKAVEPLNKKSYTPDGGTPLYDAVVETIEEVANQVDKMEEEPACLVVIMTDGEENSSKKHDLKCFQKLVHDLEHKGNWTFVYMGSNQDSWATAQKFGLSRGNVLGYVSSNLGMQSVMRSAAQDTMMYASSMVENKAKGLNVQSADFFNGKREVGEEDVLSINNVAKP